MKRVFLLLLALLLTGCGIQPETEATQAAVPEFTKPTTLYVADASVEQQTKGAVKAYQLEENCIAIGTLDGNVLLLTDLSKLILMDSETGELGASVKVGEVLSGNTPDFTASEKGITYYRTEGNELVFLSAALRQEQTVELPAGISGYPCVSRTNQEVYYCKDGSIYARHLQTGDVRSVFTGEYQSIELQESHLDGTILTCIVTDEASQETIYLDAASGRMISNSDWLMPLQTEESMYLLCRKEGIVEQKIYGSLGGENYLLKLEQPIELLARMNGGYHCRIENGALEMEFYNFASNACSSVRLEGIEETPTSVAADGKYIWILAENQLLRWDVSMTAADQNESYLTPLYTRDAPDFLGLANCARRAQELTERYGIHVAVGYAATAVSGGYTLTGEHQPGALNRMMDELENVLQQFPEDILEESLWDRDIHIGFVREISGGREAVQFYKDNESYILIAATEQLRQNILHGLGYMVDGHVLENSWVYDDWEAVNPEGFAYDYTYYSYDSHRESAYLTGENRAFVEPFAMTFPHEDRSLMFAYAMMEGKADYFAGETMQAKLSLLCEGIRDAYGYWWSEETFLWEQYLMKE